MPIYLNEIGNQEKEEPNMDEFHLWGHFSQMCWKMSKRIGFAVAEYEGFKTKDIRFQFVIVARYQSAPFIDYLLTLARKTTN
jgi:hypothetical protein